MNLPLWGVWTVPNDDLLPENTGIYVSPGILCDAGATCLHSRVGFLDLASLDQHVKRLESALENKIKVESKFITLCYYMQIMLQPLKGNGYNTANC